MLNPNEKIDSWDVIVRTVDNTPNIPNSTRSRKLTAMGDLHIELPYTATKRIDAAIEAKYPVTWNDE